MIYYRSSKQILNYLFPDFDLVYQEKKNFFLFLVFLLFTFMDLVLLKSDPSNHSTNESPVVQLSVYPNAGTSTDNIEVRCEIFPLSTISPLSSSKFDNIYLSVKTDNVKPSGILLMFDDGSDGCRINREHVHVDVCNASLIIAHIKHTILNETLQNIDYSCSKGNTYVTTSYRIISKKIFDFFCLKKNFII
jgi:hypothetical protein